MAWAFQSVLNVGIQIMLLVFMGWCFARFRLLSAEQFMGQINVLILRVAFPSLTIYLLGMRVDLRDAEVWKSLGAYVLWVTIVQVGITAYTWLCNGRNTGDAGLLNLVLTANNTVIVGLPVMQATFPEVGGRLSLLTAFVLFLQVIPYTITAFEVEKWMVEEHARQRAEADMFSEPPSTPTRELSGRWLRDLDPPSGAPPGPPGAVGTMNGNGVAPAATAVGASLLPDTRCAGNGSSGKLSLRRGALARSSGSSADGDGGNVEGRAMSRHPPGRKGRLERWRAGMGVVVGAVAGGWAPATPQDSDVSNAGSVDLAPVDDTGRGGPAAGGRQLTQQPTLARGVAPGASGGDVVVAALGGDPYSDVSISVGSGVPPVPPPRPPRCPPVPVLDVDFRASSVTGEPAPEAAAAAASADAGDGVLLAGFGALSARYSAAGHLCGLAPADHLAFTPSAARPAAPPWHGPELRPARHQLPAGPEVAGCRAAGLGSGGASQGHGAGTDTGRDDVGPVVPLLAPAPGSAALAYLNRQPSSRPGAGCSGSDVGSTAMAVGGRAAESPLAGQGSVPQGASGAAGAQDAGGRPSRVPGGPVSQGGTPFQGLDGATAPLPAVTITTSFSATEPGPPLAQQAQHTGHPGPSSAPCSSLPDHLSSLTPTALTGCVEVSAVASGGRTLCRSSRGARAGAIAVSGAARGLHRRLVPRRSTAPSDRPRSHMSELGTAVGAAAAAAAAAVAPVSSVAVATASRDRPVGPKVSGPGCGEPHLQRLSLPAHWPPVMAAMTDTRGGGEHVVLQLEGAGGAAAGGGGRAQGCPAPGPGSGLGAAAGAVTWAGKTSYCGSAVPSPPLSRRLLSPVAVACPDLPIPQAISLARAPTQALADYADGRLSHNGGDATASVLGDTSTWPAAATRPAAPEAPPSPPHSLAPPPPPAPPDRAMIRAAANSMTRRKGGLAAALGEWLKLWFLRHRRAWSITWVVIKNPLLWSLFVALVVNLSGLRTILYPGSANYRPELGWVAGTLAWTSGLTVPISLFSNGVWMYGKTFGRPTLIRACGLLALKLLLLGPLQLVCAAALGLEATAAMSLLLLALCPVATTSFVLASQYGHGEDLVTAVTMVGIVLLVPVVLVGLALPRAFGLYSYTVSV